MWPQIMGLPTLKSSNLERATTCCKTGEENGTMPEETSAGAPDVAAAVAGIEAAPVAHAASPTLQLPALLFGSFFAAYDWPNFNAPAI